MRYANAQVRPPRPGEKAYRVRGTKEPFYTLNIIDGIMSVKQVMAVAAKYNATITEYLNSVLLYALLQKQSHDWHPKLRQRLFALKGMGMQGFLISGCTKGPGRSLLSK